VDFPGRSLLMAVRRIFSGIVDGLDIMSEDDIDFYKHPACFHIILSIFLFGHEFLKMFGHVCLYAIPQQFHQPFYRIIRNVELFGTVEIVPGARDKIGKIEDAVPVRVPASRLPVEELQSRGQPRFPGRLFGEGKEILPVDVPEGEFPV
jgi:hypothetical protein